MFDSGLTSVTRELGEFWDFLSPRQFGLPYVLRKRGYIFWLVEAYVEAILGQNTSNDVGDIIMYSYVVLLDLSRELVDILIALHQDQVEAFRPFIVSDNPIFRGVNPKGDVRHRSW